MNLKITKKLKNQTNGAFTLLEMLLVIAMIAILAGIVIVAINPGRQLAQARNVARASDLRALNSAVNQYYIDNRVWPADLETYTTLTEICNTGTEPAPQLSVDCNAEGLIDLSVLVPTYISAIPRDPQVTASLPFTNTAHAQTTNGTRYEIALDPTTQMVMLTAPNSVEYDLTPVQLGTTTALVAGGVVGNPYTIPTAGLVAYWDMENNGDTVPDQSGNGNNGTQHNGVLFDESYGVFGKGASFDGNDDYIDVPDDILGGESQITISAWYSLRDTSYVYGSGSEIIYRDMTTNILIRPYVNDWWADYGPGVYITTDQGIQSVIHSSSSFYNLNDYYHIAVVYDGSNIILYINGNEVGRTPQTGSILSGNSTDNDVIGAQIGTATNFNGLMDEILFYNIALDSDSVQEIYNHGLWELNN